MCGGSPRMCSWPKYPIKNTGGSAIQVTGISSFQFWPDRRPRLWAALLAPAGQGARRPRRECVGLAVLSPLCAIPSQARIPRGKGRCFLASAALPCRQGRCRCARSTLFALRAKALQSGAPDFWACLERKQAPERFAHQATLPARRRTDRRAFPRREWSCVPSRRRNTPSPAIPSTSSARGKRGALQGTSHCHRFSCRASGVCAPGYLPHKIPAFRPSRRRLIPLRSRRETGGLCPRPLKGPDP